MKKNPTKSYRQVYKNYLSSYFSHFHNLTKIDEEYEKAYWLWKLYLDKHLDLINRKTARILDVGCGLGHGMHVFRRFGFKRISGVDINSESVKFCKKKGFAAFHSDIFAYLKNKQQEFDVVSLFDVIEHFSKEEIITLITLIRRAMNKNGLLIIQTLNASYPFFAKNFYWDITHETLLTTQSLADFLCLAGFKNNNVFSINGIHRYHPNLIIRLFRTIVLDTAAKISENLFRLAALAQGVFLKECKPYLISISRKY